MNILIRGFRSGWMWYLSLGETNANAARLAAVSSATVDRYIAIYREHGIEGLKRFDWCGPSSELLEHQASLEEMFRAEPPHTTAEAQQRIEAATGVKRGLTQTRLFLKKNLGLKWRCAAAIPLPPKKSVEEHVATQDKFLTETLEPLLESARNGEGHVFFVEAAHFVQGAFLCCLWCVQRLFIRGASGRKRYSVLGAWNAITNSLVSITTCGTVSSETMCDLLRRIAAQGLNGPVTLVLDNARYQHCAVVKTLAGSLHIDLKFLPSYSPNLNIIERLWKFIKRDVLYGKHYDAFAAFCLAIDGCLAKIPTTHKAKLASLMTHNFQRFKITSFLTA